MKSTEATAESDVRLRKIRVVISEITNRRYESKEEIKSTAGVRNRAELKQVSP